MVHLVPVFVMRDMENGMLSAMFLLGREMPQLHAGTIPPSGKLVHTLAVET